jgi:hypothetical protein
MNHISHIFALKRDVSSFIAYLTQFEPNSKKLFAAPKLHILAPMVLSLDISQLIHCKNTFCDSVYVLGLFWLEK